MNIKIFTDGASRGNPGPGGWGAIVITDGTVTELGGAEKNTTNNRMELQAVIGALSFVELETENESQIISLYTDSSYVLKGANTWLVGWERGGWKTKTKGEVLNKDLWQRLSAVMAHKKIEWHLVSGHAGLPGNEKADEIATAFADGKNRALFSGPIGEYKTDILNVTYDVIAQEKRADSKSRSRAKAYSYISKVNGTIEIHKTWAECEKRVKGAAGALYKKSLDAEDEKAIVADFLSR